MSDGSVLVWNRNQAPSLLRNDLKGGNHWLQVKLTGTKSNRAAIGSTVTVEFGGRRQARAVMSQSSFTSASDLRLHFGLGKAASAKVTVQWPSGAEQIVDAAEVDRVLAITEK